MSSSVDEDRSQYNIFWRTIYKIWDFYAWIQRFRLVRAFERYQNVRGYLLAGGFAYVTLFSLFAVLTLLFSVLSWVLAGQSETRQAIINAISSSWPGLLTTNTQHGIVDPDHLFITFNFSLTSIIAVLVLLYAANRVMMSLKASVRQMFGIVIAPGNSVLDYLRDMFGFIIIAATLFFGISLSLALTKVGTWLFHIGGIDSQVSQFWLRVGAVTVAFLIDMILMIVVIRLVAGARPPLFDLLGGAGIGALGMGIMRMAGSVLVGNINNPILAGATAIVALMVIVNMLGRVILIAAAWTANPPAPPIDTVPEQMHARETPNYVTLSAPHTLTWPHQPYTGALAADYEALTPQDLEKTGS